MYIRILCLFIDILFVFADNFASFEKAAQLLISWIVISNNSSIYFKKTRSRIVIVTSYVEYRSSSILDILNIENIQQKFYNKLFRNFFFTIKILYLTVKQKSSIICFRKLKRLLRKKLDKILVVRKNLDYLYFAVYFSCFFCLTVNYIVAIFNQFFDFIFANRQNNKI